MQIPQKKLRPLCGYVFSSKDVKLSSQKFITMEGAHHNITQDSILIMSIIGIILCTYNIK